MCAHIPLKERSQIRKVMLQKWRHKKRKHSVHTHFPRDRNCDICLRTKITRVPCRRRNEGSVPRAEKFGDLITADHKVLNEGSESREQSSICTVVVQESAAFSEIQSFPCKNKNSQETSQKSRRTCLEPLYGQFIRIWKIL